MRAHIAQAALEGLLDEKEELAKYAAELEARLRQAESAEAAAAATSRTTLLSAEEGVSLEPGQAARTEETADQERGGDGAVGTTAVNAGGHSAGGGEHAGAEETTRQHQGHQPTSVLLLRQAEVAAGRSRAEVDHLRDELDNARAEQAQVAAAAAEEREVSVRRVSELEAAILQTKQEYQDHRDKAESRLETLRVAFDQENEESDAQVIIGRLSLSHGFRVKVSCLLFQQAWWLGCRSPKGTLALALDGFACLMVRL